MRVELGNTSPKNPSAVWDGRPTTTYLNIPDYAYSMPEDDSDEHLHPELAAALSAVPDGPNKRALRKQLIDGHFAHDSGVKGLPNHEALVCVIHPSGAWRAHANAEPTWVWSDNAVLQAMLADYYGVPAGHPDDFRDSHWHRFNGISYPPGTVHDVQVDMIKVNGGYDAESWMFGGGPNLNGGSWSSGSATSTSGTSLTNTGTTFPTATVNGEVGLAGQMVCAGPNTSGTGSTVFGIITTNSGTVLTVDQWYAPNGLGVGTTPNGTATYQIVPGASVFPYVALDSSTHTPAASDTALTTEVYAASGGLNRKIAPYAHTAAANTYTLTPVYTANGNDSLPVTIKNIGVFNSVVHSQGILLFYTTLNATATLSASGDQLTVTETITM